MSSATPSPLSERDSTLYLRDMAEFCERVLAYPAGHYLPMWMADRMRYDATLRNRLAHAYLGIEPETVWLIATRNVPTLREQLTALLARLA